MGSIVLLDENTINKIAAGEVVDRPSSIVKELVENSIDAGSKNITVEIKNGGISYIKIIDDGEGFKSDDVELAFERHATSKIRQESDILKITSMGFRGEALASIAAISNLQLTTKNINEDKGTKVIFSGGNLVSKEVSPSNVGSTFIIKDIFFNTPARFKFLKKDYTEAGYIEEVVIRIALANPNVAIKYINNFKTVITTKGDGDLNNVIYSIFGKEIYSNVLNIDYTYENMKITGVIGKSNISRSTRTNEYTFINSRFVKDKILMSAIEKAFNEKLAINKFPFAIINLEMNTDQIDVNVHPAKLEVKFENESKVFEAIFYAIKDRLEKENIQTSPFSIINSKVDGYNLNNNINTNINTNENINTNTNTKLQEENDKLYVSNIQNENSNTNNNCTNTDNYTNTNINTLNNQESQVVTKFLESINNSEITYDNKNNTTNEVEDYQVISKEDEQNFIPKVNEEENISSYKYIGILFNTYILIEIEDKLYMIDQHAAHERLIYERVKTNYYNKQKETQMLLIPMVIELKNIEVITVMNNIEQFEKCGYMLEQFGENAIKISGVPNIPGIHLDDKEIFLDMIDELKDSAKTLRQDKEFRFLATVACKAAVKGNMFLDRKEHTALLDEMIKLKNPFTCPHGRPTAYEISKIDIEKKVDRR